MITFYKPSTNCIKPVFFLMACLFFLTHAKAQTPFLNFDPIAASTISSAPFDQFQVMGPADAAGNIYITQNNRVSRMTPDGISTVIAGTGVPGFTDGPGSSAQFWGLTGLTRDAAGNIYVSDSGNNAIRKITPAGIVSTIAGNGTAGYQDGPGPAALFNYPRRIAVDAAGNVFVADEKNLSIREITPAGTVSTLASALAGAQFTDFQDMTIDPAGNLYVVQRNADIQKITPAGIVTPIPSSHQYNGFNFGIAVDKKGNLYTAISDGFYKDAIYKIFPSNRMAPLAGTNIGYKDSIGIYSKFTLVQNLSIDDQGNFYLLDYGRIRKLSKPVLDFTTVAGTPSAAKYFAVSANYLIDLPRLQAPAGFELSQNELGPYSPTLVIGLSGDEIPIVNIYIRLSANAQAGLYADSIMLTSPGAVTKKLGVSGTVTNSPRKLVVIGSATSSCLGVSPASDCYVSRLASFYNKVGPFDTTIDNTLARVNTNCYNGMPSSYVSPYSAASGYTPIKEINITAALALHPNAILVNYPSNGYDVLSVNEIMFCLRTIRDSANQQGIPCFITTTQPRTSPVPFNTSAMKLKLAILKDSILAAFGSYAIDFWTGLTNPADSSILYDQGDHINMNGAGHNILFQHVLAKNVLSASTPAGIGTGLMGVYYNGIALAGAPLLTRIDPTINFKFDWEQQPIVLSPAPGIVPEDFYSVRWTGFVQPLFSELYTFYTNSDDGIRVWINNSLLIDSWIDQNGSITRSGTYLMSAGEKYEIRIEFYEKTSASLTKLYWSSASTPMAIIPQSQLYPAAITPPVVGTGLQGVYYNGIALAGTPLLTRIDPTINFKLDWEQQPIILSPAPGIVPEDFYSVRWTGFVQPLFSETYTFYTNSDDGIRLWVNNVLLIDSWIDQNGSITRSGTIALVAGQKYDIKIEFYEKASASLTKLWWSSASTTKAIIPQSQLFPPDDGARMADMTLQTKLLPDASAFAFTTAIISPNPVKRGQAARLQINSHRAGAAIVSVLSSNGARISNQVINLVKGVNTTTVSTNTLAQGLYLISITGGSKPLTVKLVID